jgi:3-methylcrotonyl-CoA carboxylase beta subunit
MVEGTSFMGLGGPNLVKGATGQTVDSEELGGARVHTEVSGVAHYRVPDDRPAWPSSGSWSGSSPWSPRPGPSGAGRLPSGIPSELYEILPEDHRQPYEMHQVLECILDGGRLDEFQPDRAREMICGTGHIDGVPVGVIANARGLIKDPRGGKPTFGGIVYTERPRRWPTSSRP